MLAQVALAISGCQLGFGGAGIAEFLLIHPVVFGGEQCTAGLPQLLVIVRFKTGRLFEDPAAQLHYDSWPGNRIGRWLVACC